MARVRNRTRKGIISAQRLDFAGNIASLFGQFAQRCFLRAFTYPNATGGQIIKDLPKWMAILSRQDYLLTFSECQDRR